MVFTMHVIIFYLHATKREWKSAQNLSRCYVTPQTQRQCTLRVRALTLQHVEKFEYLRGYSQVTENGARTFVHGLSSKRSSGFAQLVSSNTTNPISFQIQFSSDLYIWSWSLGADCKSAILGKWGRDRIFRRVQMVKRRDKQPSCKILISDNVESLFLHKDPCYVSSAMCVKNGAGEIGESNPST